MADVVEEEELNKMNARSIAMVFSPNMTQEMDTGSELEGPTSDYEESARSSEDEDEVRVFVKTLRGEQNCRKQLGADRSTNRRVARGISEPSKLLELQHGLWHIIL
ncbi:hypothetical protein C1H46_003359 [Malus baccata]|uniref:Rho-GAP domain-containing protein n=1 Tax=Malus baccata TaxID=106549 RepID=A0A540NIT7_MALBA|nr:hypothetical protein C1H46_003359 [Malus baccata]